MSDASRVRVAFACNDARGVFVGGFSAIEFDSPFGHHVSAEGRRKRLGFTLHGTRVRVGRVYFIATDRKIWEGNMMWDGVRMPVGEARRLLANLKADGWIVTEATMGNPFEQSPSATPEAEPVIGSQVQTKGTP